jgi:hypothetical protein
MFGKFQGISPKNFEARTNLISGGALPGKRIGQGPAPSTTQPLCLCELQREVDKRKKRNR